MKTGKKLISLLLMLCMAVLLAPAASGAESGICGEKAKWNLEDGVLTITGSGDMADYASADETPWAALRGQIKKVVFDGAIIRIGSNTFAECPNLTHVTFSTSTVTIGKRAFYNCTQLASADYKEPSGENGEENSEENGETSDTNIPGDVNSDGIVDGRDSIRLMKYLAGETDEATGTLIRLNLQNADVNADAIVDEKDLLRLMRYLGGSDVVLETGTALTMHEQIKNNMLQNEEYNPWLDLNDDGQISSLDYILAQKQGY